MTISDIEKCLLHISHRTDAGKMHFYRQYKMWLNFHKEGYIHIIMTHVDNINGTSNLCYVSSKCYPSREEGVIKLCVLVTFSNSI